ncbi:hypothetical protein [Bradyrhizobium sp. ARR65]|uniref:hypothetical protein n=1 Tax=Bradyrhizobium sp. ARR65 TaxID=1040989 RepID=UPI000AAB6F6E|nr:hypothetical protein [Bradyrhizobium sp. ARR65]
MREPEQASRELLQTSILPNAAPMTHGSVKKILCGNANTSASFRRHFASGKLELAY